MSTPQADSVRHALIRAIQIGRRNSELYESLANISSDNQLSTRDMFLALAEEERRHGAQLRERYRARFGPLPLLTGEPQDDIGAPALQNAETLVFDSMTPEHALQTGLLAEEAAQEFYRAEMLRNADPELLPMYRELFRFENSKVRFLQRKLHEARHGRST